MNIKMLLSLTLMVSVITGVTQVHAKMEPELDKTPVIVNTDMGFDDWMAILYLLNSNIITVEAIMVDCAGETYCPQGAINATKLLKLSGKENIPVFYGVAPISSHRYHFPNVIRKSATAMAVPGFTKLPPKLKYASGAALELEKRIVAAGMEGKPLTIVSIGSSTNISDAISSARLKQDNNYYSMFKQGVKMVYQGGGAVGLPKGNHLSNSEIPGNLNIPGLYSSDNKTAEWNIYANAAATQVLFTSQLPVTLVTVNLSDQVRITEASYKKLVTSAVTASAKFVASDIISNIDSQGGWEKAELDYWDPSVAVAAIHPEFVTSRYDHVEACVQTNGSNTHGTTYVAPKCATINESAGYISVFTGIDVNKFYKEFIGTLNQ